MPKKHDRKLGLCGAALTTTRIPNFDIEVGTTVRDDLEEVMLECGFLEDAPFEWVTISLRYGLKNENEPHYEPINKEYGDLPLAIELDTSELVGCRREEMQEAFEVAALKALVHAGRKFNLEHSALEARLEARIA
ncbi:MAG: immunity protein 39 [Deltaproteobacteria bacterium]|nr:immunity protein 39 [Deltaproteobacteria bacterium]